MSGHTYVLRCGFRSGCTLLHFGLGQILAVDRDRGPTLGARKDGLAPLVLQRCFGPCMWRALLRHILLPPQICRLFFSPRLLAAGVASNSLAPLSPRPYAPQGVLAHGGRVVRTCLTSCE